MPSETGFARTLKNCPPILGFGRRQLIDPARLGHRIKMQVREHQKLPGGRCCRTNTLVPRSAYRGGGGEGEHHTQRKSYDSNVRIIDAGLRRYGAVASWLRPTRKNQPPNSAQAAGARRRRRPLPPAFADGPLAVPGGGQ